MATVSTFRSGRVIGTIIIDSTVLFLPGGDVYDWTRDVTQEVGRAARTLCPPGRTRRRATTRYVNKGMLRRSIRTKATVGGARLDVGTIKVGPVDQGGGDYTGYVLAGTAHQGRRYIYSARGYQNKVTIDAVITRRGVVSLGIGQSVTKDFLPPTWAMRFRTDGGRHWRVRGQRRNPFLTDGYNLVAARHGALGRMRGPLI